MLRFMIVGALFMSVAHGLIADEPRWEAMLGAFPKSEGAGFGGLCGICVEPASGDVIINISDRGFYRSTDAGKTFQRISQTQPKGRTETPGCFLIDPTGKSKTMLTALVYGAPPSTSDDGAVWKPMSNKASHIDWCAIDWTDPEHKFVLALKHESGELLIASHDGGKTFTDIGKGYGPGWVFNPTTAVVAQAKTKERPKPGLVRTEDGGKTWTPCGDYSPVGTQQRPSLAALAGRHALLARRWRSHFHRRHGQDLENAGCHQGCPLRPRLRRDQTTCLRVNRGRRHRIEGRWSNVVQTDAGTARDKTFGSLLARL